jgi:hypothetical protein
VIPGEPAPDALRQDRCWLRGCPSYERPVNRIESLEGAAVALTGADFECYYGRRPCDRSRRETREMDRWGRASKHLDN